MYMAFEYSDKAHTKFGLPNQRTGRLSTAGELFIFKTHKEREEWLGGGFYTKRKAVSKREARSLCAGMTVEKFHKYLEEVMNKNVNA